MPYSAGEWLRSINFWRKLTCEQKIYFAEVTQAPPLDPHGGLWDVHNKLYRSQRNEKVFLCGILIVRIILNLNTIYAAFTPDFFRFGARNLVCADRTPDGFSNVTTFPHTWLGEHQFNDCATMVRVQKTDDIFSEDLYLRWCEAYDADVPLSSIRPSKCKKQKELTRHGSGLFFVSWIVPLFEQIITAWYLIEVIVGWILYVPCGSTTFFLKHRTLFVEGPRRLASFSALRLIRYWSPAMAQKLPDQLTYYAVTMFPWFMGSWRVQQGFDSIKNLLAFLLILIFTAVSAMSMLLRLTCLFWVSAVSPEVWTCSNILQFIGFLNQVAGIFDVDAIELDRLFLFKFGGADVRWHIHERFKQVAYWDLLLLKMCFGKFSRGMVERMQGWMCLAVFTSADLQRLWLRGDVEERLEDPKALAAEVLALDQRLDPIYWPAKGSDSDFCKRDESEDWMHPLDVVPSSDSSSLRLAYFLENIQSYRISLLKGAKCPIVVYGSNGEIVTGSVAEAVQPRVTDLREEIRELLQNPRQRELNLASKLQAEIEDLEAMESRSQHIDRQGKARHMALPEDAQNALAKKVAATRASLTSRQSQTHKPTMKALRKALNTEKEKVNSFLESITLVEAPPSRFELLIRRLLDEEEKCEERLPRKTEHFAEDDPFLTYRERLLRATLDLHVVYCTRPSQLLAALKKLVLPERFSSISAVVEYRNARIQEANDLSEKLEALDDAGDEMHFGEAQETCTEGWLLFHQLWIDQAMQGYEDRLRKIPCALDKLERRMVLFELRQCCGIHKESLNPKNRVIGLQACDVLLERVIEAVCSALPSVVIKWFYKKPLADNDSVPLKNAGTNQKYGATELCNPSMEGTRV